MGNLNNSAFISAMKDGVLCARRSKVHLKPLDINNADEVTFMFQVRSHPDIDKYLNGDPPSSYFEHVHYLAKAIENKYFYIIYYHEDFVGYCQITPREDALELGWALHPNSIGIGIGTIAIPLLIDICKGILCKELKKQKIILYVKEDNIRAVSLYKKFNFIEKENTNGIILMELAHE
jgi:RimJ/RimL family protein N-acetyltransferase